MSPLKLQPPLLDASCFRRIACFVAACRCVFLLLLRLQLMLLLPRFLLSLVWLLVVAQVRHKPNVPLPLPGRKMEGKRSEETLQIRLYAVDCPEVAHFGNPAQAFSAEAKEVRQQPPVLFLPEYGFKTPSSICLMFSHYARILFSLGTMIISLLTVHMSAERKVRVPGIRHILPRPIPDDAHF